MSDPVLRSTAPAQRHWFAIAVGAAALSMAAVLVFPAAAGRAVDTALGRHGRLSAAVTNLALLLVVMALAEVAGQLAAVADTANTTAGLRRRMSVNLLGFGLPGRRRYPPGAATARITTGAAAGGALRALTLSACVTALSAVGALVALAFIDWVLPVTVLIGLPVLRLFLRGATETETDRQPVLRDVSARYTDAAAGLRTIRAAGTAATEVDRVLEPLNRLRKAESATHYAWSYGPLVAILQIAVIAVAGWSLGEGRISPGDVAAAIGYAMIALGTLDRLDVFVALGRARTAAAVAKELAADVPVVPRERLLPVRPGLVELRSVTVSVDGRTVLDGCTLTVPAGTTLAVAGPPGAGKSALIGLLGRLVEPDSGAVLVDGCDVSTLDRAQLRGAVGYAFKRPVLVGATVSQAIGYAASTPFEPAAVAAHADEFIRRLPGGYRARLADVPLSAGQRQRIGIARTIAQQPRILVLDDAAAGLPVDVLPGRTRIVLARRQETAAAADRVAWLENGVIRRIGPHEELLDEADYRALWS